MNSQGPFNVGGNIFQDRSGEKNKEGQESGNEREVEEPRSGAWENMKSTEDDTMQGAIFWRLIGFLIVAFAVAITIPFGRTVGMIVGLLVGLYFGVKWLVKGIIRQEVRLFSRESGFYWLILSFGSALVLFLTNYLAGMHLLP